MIMKRNSQTQDSLAAAGYQFYAQEAELFAASSATTVTEAFANMDNFLQSCLISSQDEKQFGLKATWLEKRNTG